MRRFESGMLCFRQYAPDITHRQPAASAAGSLRKERRRLLTKIEKAILWDMLRKRRQDKAEAEKDIEEITDKLFGEDVEDPYEFTGME